MSTPIEAVAKQLEAALDAAESARNPGINRKIKATTSVASADRRYGNAVSTNMLARIHGACPRLAHALDILTAS